MGTEFHVETCLINEIEFLRNNGNDNALYGSYLENSFPEQQYIMTMIKVIKCENGLKLDM